MLACHSPGAGWSSMCNVRCEIPAFTPNCPALIFNAGLVQFAAKRISGNRIHDSAWDYICLFAQAPMWRAQCGVLRHLCSSGLHSDTRDMKEIAFLFKGTVVFQWMEVAM